MINIKLRYGHGSDAQKPHDQHQAVERNQVQAEHVDQARDEDGPQQARSLGGSTSRENDGNSANSTSDWSVAS